VPNVMGVLRAEIRRLARKETRDEIRALRKQVNALRRRMAEARRRIDSVERNTRAAVAKGAVAAAAASGAAESGKQVRFSPAWVRSHRKRIGLSRLKYARLLGVSAQTILGWESGRTRPRRNALAVWRSLREKGVRELKTMLEGAAAGARAARAGRRKRRVARRKVRGARRAVRRVRRVVRRVVRRAARKTVRAKRRTRRVTRRVVRKAVRAKKK